MANPDSPNPLFPPPPRPGIQNYPEQLDRWLNNTIQTIENNYQWKHSPVLTGHYAEGNLPDPAKWIHSIIMYLPSAGPLTPAYSDGSDWLALVPGTVVT